MIHCSRVSSGIFQAINSWENWYGVSSEISVFFSSTRGEPLNFLAGFDQTEKEYLGAVKILQIFSSKSSLNSESNLLNLSIGFLRISIQQRRWPKCPEITRLQRRRRWLRIDGGYMDTVCSISWCRCQGDWSPIINLGPNKWTTGEYSYYFE